MQGDLLETVSLDAGTRAGFISDLHLGPGDPAIERRFRTFLETAGSRLDVLFILGDLFEFWIGDDATSLCGYTDAVHMLRRYLAHPNRRGLVMHGNRDFLLGGRFCGDTGCRLLADPCILDFAGVRVLLSHGDAYCADDVDHQRFRAMVRDPRWQAEFLARKAAERLDYAIAARARSETGKSSKSDHIMDVNDSAIRSAMRDHGVRYMIHGHTHRPAVHRLTIDGRPAFRVVLGAWFDSANSLRIDDDAIHYEIDGTEHVVPLE